MFDAALSTMWAVGQLQGLADFFVAGEALGYAGFELNHEVNSAILNRLDLRSYRITGIHEPCPANIPTAELKAQNWLISSLHFLSAGFERARQELRLPIEIGLYWRAWGPFYLCVNLGRDEF